MFSPTSLSKTFHNNSKPQPNQNQSQKSNNAKTITQTNTHRVCIVLGNYYWAQSYSGMNLTYPVTFLLSLHQQISITDSFLIRVVFLCALPHFSGGTLSGLNLCRSYACCHSLCEFMCTWVLVRSRKHCFLEVSRHLWLLQAFCLLSPIDPQTLRVGVWHCAVMGLGSKSHILQEERSLWG